MRSIKLLSILVILLCGFQSARADWVKQTTNSFAWFHDVYFLNDSKGWIVGDDGTILTTVDGGATWNKERKIMNDSISQIHMVNETNGWMLCQRNIYARGANASSYIRKTVDGGRNWEKFEFQDGGRERVTKLLFNKDGSATAFGEGGIFYKLQEDGVTWKKIQTAIHFLLLDGSFGDTMTGVIVGAGGTIMFTDDSGFTWEKATLLGDTNVKFNAVAFIGGKGGWAVGTGGRIFHSNGGARLWRQQQSATDSNLNDVYFASSSSGWAVGDEGTILRTTDGGSNWFEMNSKVTHRLEKIYSTGNKIWAVGFGGTVLVNDGKAATPETREKPVLMKRS